MAETGSRNDPYSAFNFVLEIDDVAVAGFSECSGLDTESDVVEYREGNDKDGYKAKLPGLPKVTNISLKRGFTTDKVLWDWRKKVIDGKTQRTKGAVVLLNEAREPALRYTFYEAWPSKWQGPTLNAGSSEVAIETLEIACERIELE